MIPSPWVYHGLNFLSTFSGEVKIKDIEVRVRVVSGKNFGLLRSCG